MIVALTGGIGSGKSTVGKFFEKLGVPLYNSDTWAKEIMQSDKLVKQAIIQLLGARSYNGELLNRGYIAEAVFQDRELLKALNGIVHPAVRNHFLSWNKEQDFHYVIQEAAVIFENGTQDFYDKIILVTAPKEIRIDRIHLRDGTSEKQILARIENQWPDTRKIPLADYVIENIDLDKTGAKVGKIHGLLLQINN